MCSSCFWGQLHVTSVGCVLISRNPIGFDCKVIFGGWGRGGVRGRGACAGIRMNSVGCRLCSCRCGDQKCCWGWRITQSFCLDWRWSKCREGRDSYNCRARSHFYNVRRILSIPILEGARCRTRVRFPWRKAMRLFLRSWQAAMRRNRIYSRHLAILQVHSLFLSQHSMTYLLSLHFAAGR